MARTLKPWTTAEIRLLLQHPRYGETGLLMKLTGRSRQSIISQRYRVKRDSNGKN